MPVTVEFRALHRAIDDLRTAVDSLRGTHGEIPVVARLQNDLERLILDVADADTLTAPIAATAHAPMTNISGSAAATNVDHQPGVAGDSAQEQYAVSAWGEDMDDEGVGGFHGHRPGASRR